MEENIFQHYIDNNPDLYIIVEHLKDMSSNKKIKNFRAYGKHFIGSTFETDEVRNNVNPNVFFICSKFTFFNGEAAARFLSFYFNEGGVLNTNQIISSGSIAVGNSYGLGIGTYTPFIFRSCAVSSPVISDTTTIVVELFRVEIN